MMMTAFRVAVHWRQRHLSKRRKETFFVFQTCLTESRREGLPVRPELAKFRNLGKKIVQILSKKIRNNFWHLHCQTFVNI
jgi:hypothetical protein